MKSRLTAALAIVCTCALAGALYGGAAGAETGGRVPVGFFGIAPQTPLTPRDAAYMRAGGIETIRMTVPWGAVQPTAKRRYDWSSIDETVAIASRAGLHVLPFLGGTPSWLGRRTTKLPIYNARERSAWKAFLRAAVTRYGPHGSFWIEHALPREEEKPTGGISYQPAESVVVEAAVPKMPIHTWQVWNEANFFYFAFPASPTRYARLIKMSSRAIKHADPHARVLLTGLFGRPDEGVPKGMHAANFLRRLYRVPGIKRSFDAVALHPYAINTKSLEEMVEEMHEVQVENHDRVPLYITEMGWGSQNDYQVDAFEQGIRGQVRQLRGAYRYLLENRRRLNLHQVDWFTWKDAPVCNFCDSTGFFREGAGFHPKPAWRAFVALTGGRARPRR
jgi:hypothetical protein